MRRRMRARGGARSTHALVEALRERVDVLVASTQALATSTQTLATDMRQLGHLLGDLADTVDGHETRLTELERKRK